MQKIDANILLRYVLNDHPELSMKAKEIIDNNTVEVPIEVLCEAVFVLTGYYGINRKTVSVNLKYFFEHTNCILHNREAVLQGITFFGSNSIDFVDCLLAGYAKTENVEIYTFDHKLQKLIAKIKQ